MKNPAKQCWSAIGRGVLFALLGWLIINVPPWIWLFVEANKPGDVTPITYAAVPIVLLTIAGLPAAVLGGVAISVALYFLVVWDGELRLPMGILVGTCIAGLLGFLIFEGTFRILSGIPFAWYDSAAGLESLMVLGVYEVMCGLLGGVHGWRMVRYLRLLPSETPTLY